MKTLNEEILEKDSTIKNLQQALNDIKVENRELVAVSKNKKPVQKQVVLLKTDDRLVWKEQ